MKMPFLIHRFQLCGNIEHSKKKTYWSLIQTDKSYRTVTAPPTNTNKWQQQQRKTPRLKIKSIHFNWNVYLIKHSTHRLIEKFPPTFVIKKNTHWIWFLCNRMRTKNGVRVIQFLISIFYAENMCVRANFGRFCSRSSHYNWVWAIQTIEFETKIGKCVYPIPWWPMSDYRNIVYIVGSDFLPFHIGIGCLFHFTVYYYTYYVALNAIQPL